MQKIFQRARYESIREETGRESIIYESLSRFLYYKFGYGQKFLVSTVKIDSDFIVKKRIFDFWNKVGIGYYTKYNKETCIFRICPDALKKIFGKVPRKLYVKLIP